MMTRKNLNQLLEQDQEPFLLKNYISDHRSQLKNHLRRRTPTDGGVLRISEPTAALLLEAAMKIHNQSILSPKPKSKGRKFSVGIFDSMFRRFGNRSRNLNDKGVPIGTQDNSRSESTVRSEKSLDLENCYSSSPPVSREYIPATENQEPVTSMSREENQYFNSNPQNPFRFSLVRTPEFSSPEASSPRPPSKEVILNNLNKVEEEEEKEQCSPVSILEPLFEDDYDYDPKKIEQTYEMVQKTKHQLLEKLMRFERLAKLDPFELDKTLFYEYDEDETKTEEQGQEQDCFAMEIVIEKMVCLRLEKWEEGKRESIDMMVEMDLRREGTGGWKKIDEKATSEVGEEMGGVILGELMDELLGELLKIVVC